LEISRKVNCACKYVARGLGSISTDNGRLGRVARGGEVEVVEARVFLLVGTAHAGAQAQYQWHYYTNAHGSCMYVRMCVCKHVCMYECMYVCIYVCVHVEVVAALVFLLVGTAHAQY